MKEQLLLLFRRGAQTYGVPTEDVSGVISNSWVRELSTYDTPDEILLQQDEPITILGSDGILQPSNNKCAIILHCNGLQVILIVDEIISATTLRPTKQARCDATIASFQIWKFPTPIEDIP